MVCPKFIVISFFFFFSIAFFNYFSSFFSSFVIYIFYCLNFRFKTPLIEFFFCFSILMVWFGFFVSIAICLVDCLYNGFKLLFICNHNYHLNIYVYYCNNCGRIDYIYHNFKQWIANLPHAIVIYLILNYVELCRLYYPWILDHSANLYLFCCQISPWIILLTSILVPELYITW